MEYQYQSVDVFTTSRFGGNPLAVILDAQGLSDTQMQSIAAEFSYSETTFVLPPSDPANTARVRIFTPTGEVPFAGHPNVGTAFVLARQGELFGRPIGAQMRFEEAAGLVTVQVVENDGQVTGAAITAPRQLEIGPVVPVELVAAYASLASDNITVTTHPPRFVSVDLPFVVAELTSRAALAQAKPNLLRFEEADRTFPETQVGFSLFVYVPTDASGTSFAARMFAPLDNVFEDPATGSASAALAAYRVALNHAADRETAIVITQGEDMGRPSRIELTVRAITDDQQQVVVRGDCVPVMRGILTM